MTVTVRLIEVGFLRTDPTHKKKKQEELEIKGRIETIVRIGQKADPNNDLNYWEESWDLLVSITEKSPGDLRRRAVTQTLLEDYTLTLLWKSSKLWYYNNLEKNEKKNN